MDTLEKVTDPNTADPLTQEILKLGYSVGIKRWNPHKDSMILGYVVEHEGLEIVYRVDEDEPETVILVSIRRLREKKGLENTFEPILWLGHLMLRSDYPFKRVKGLIRELRDVTLPNGKRLSVEKMIQAHKRLFDAYLLEVDYGEEWLCHDLEKLEGLLVYKKWLRGQRG